MPGRHGRLPRNPGGDLSVQIYPDLESLSQAAAILFVDQVGRAISARGRCSVALAGGETPRRTYELLSQSPYREGVAWEQIHVFWGDERCVPLSDPRSNARLAREVWLNHVPIPADQIHPLDCRFSPGAAARGYQGLLRDFFGGQPRFDLVFLGLGENGHTASLFPGTAVLEEEQRWAAAVYVAAQNLHRVTLTAPIINHARQVVFLVAGAAKARVLREVLQGPYDPRRRPAQLIRPQAGELHWLVDQAAAGELQ